MSEKLYRKWEEVISKKKINFKEAKNLYEEEGKKYLLDFSNLNELSQGWRSTFKLTKNIVIDWLYRSNNPYSPKILDLGCGASPKLYLTILYSAKCDFFYFGGEISISKLRVFLKIVESKQVKTKERKYKLVSLDCDKLPFPSKTFDFIICTDLLEHMENPSLALNEMNRVLKNNGLIVISTPNRRRPDVVIRKAIDLFKLKKIPKNKYFCAISHINEFTYHEFRRILETSRLLVRKKYTLNYPFSISEIKKAGSDYLKKLPNFLLYIPYVILNFIIKPLRWGTHIFVVCKKIK